MNKKNPWKTLSNTISYDNPWIQVQHNEVLTPSGSEGVYGVVHYKNYAIGILPLDQELNTFLVGQYRYALQEYSWEIPAGGCPENTDLLVTAKRELKEEVGLSAKKWKHLLKMHLSNSVSDEVAYLFIAQDLAMGEAEPEDTEDFIIKKIPFSEAYQMVINEEITDSMSVAAILKTKILIEKGEI